MAELMFQNFAQTRNPRNFQERANHFEDMSDSELRRHYRFGRENLHYILDLIRDEISPSTLRSNSISAELQLLIALRFYACGSFQQVVGDTVGVEKSTVCRIVRRVSLALSRLLPQYCNWPTEERKNEIKAGFFQVAGFPGVVGCIDGTHVRIQAPSEGEPAFVNRKGYHSINVQAVCDHEGKFTDVVSRWPGATHDAYIFRNSKLKERLDRHSGIQDGILLGDSGYACKPYLLTPYLRPSTRPQERFNGAHKKTTTQVERAFGWLKRRFGVLHEEIRMHPERVCTIIGACFVFHNIALLLKEPLPQDDQPDEMDAGDIGAPDQPEDDGKRVRDYLTRTFFAV